jgi:hypothetical protein
MRPFVQVLPSCWCFGICLLKNFVSHLMSNSIGSLHYQHEMFAMHMAVPLPFLGCGTIVEFHDSREMIVWRCAAWRSGAGRLRDQGQIFVAITRTRYYPS